MWERGRAQREQNHNDGSSDQSSLMDEIRSNLSVLTISTSGTEDDLDIAHGRATAERRSAPPSSENVSQTSSVSYPYRWSPFPEEQASVYNNEPNSRYGEFLTPEGPKLSSSSVIGIRPTSHIDVLKAIVAAFPIDVQFDQIVELVDTELSPDLGQGLREMFAKRKDLVGQHAPGYMNVFKLEKPWEPKWFINFLRNLITTTRDRGDFERFLDATNEQNGQSWIHKGWSSMGSFVTWSAGITCVILFVNAICWLLENEGTNLAVPLSFFAAILVNAFILHMGIEI